MEQYRNELDRLTVDRADQEALAQWLMEKKNAPRHTKRASRVFRPALIAAACAALLVTAALALSPTLRDALQKALGGFAPYAQDMAEDQVSCTDQGIEVRVVSALMDEVDGTAYVEVTDLTGDRLGMDMELWERWRCLRPEAYDPETKTALFAVPLTAAINEFEKGRTEALVLSFEQLQPGAVELYGEKQEHRFPDGTRLVWYNGVEIPKACYAARSLATRPLTEAEKADNPDYHADLSVLVPDQTPADLGCEYFSLSSAGFDADGALHIQLAMAPGVSLKNDSDLMIHITPGLRNTDIGLPNGLEVQGAVLEGGKYLDVAFPDVGVEFLPLLPDAIVTGEVYTAPAIEGTWELAFPYQPLRETVVELDQPFCYSGVDLVDARLTAMSFQLTYTRTGSIYMGGIPVCLFCKDGTVLELDFYDQTPLYQNSDGEITPGSSLTYEQRTQGADGWQEYAERDSWKYPQAVDPQNVAGFSFGLWYVPLDGSGTGYWLPDAPQATAP